MFSGNGARFRLWSETISLALIILLSFVVMGTIGVNGSITFEDLDKGCLLFISIDNKVPTYNQGFCLFPIVGAALNCVFAIIFVALTAMVLRRKDDFSPRWVSYSLLITSLAMMLFSFAICGEIGIGLDKGCKSVLPTESKSSCQAHNNFSSLHTAQICAGLMGGFWFAVLALEAFQIKRHPGTLSQQY